MKLFIKWEKCKFFERTRLSEWEIDLFYGTGFVWFSLLKIDLFVNIDSFFMKLIVKMFYLFFRFVFVPNVSRSHCR